MRTLPEKALSLVAWGLRSIKKGVSKAPEPSDEATAPAHIDTEELHRLELCVPADFLSKPDAMQRLLMSLPNSQAAMSFEMLASSSSLSVSLVVRAPELRATKQQLAAHLPAVVVTEKADDLSTEWSRREELGSVVLDFALAEEFMRPIREAKNFDPDPLVSLVAALADLDGDELAVLQVSLQRCREPWMQATQHALVTPRGQPFFADAPEMLSLASTKFETPMFAVGLRLGCKARSEHRAWSIAQSVWRGLESFNRSGSNRLIPLDPGPYPPEAMQEDLLLRQSRRSGMLLSCGELCSLVHPPGRSVVSDKLVRISENTRAAPLTCHEGSIQLGVNHHAGREQSVYLPDRLRSRHMHLVGASGTGKSTLILQMAMQDLSAGRGLALIDPHGDLVDDLLARMPASRRKDLILVDPSDPDYSVGFNVLSARNDLEKQLLSSDLVASFQRLSTSWGDQMTSVLGNAVLAMLESSEDATLADLRRFLVEKDFRMRFLESVDDSEVHYFWKKQFPLLSGKPQAPLLTRLDTFLRHRLVRHMVAQKKSSFELREVMDQGGILLIRLSQGAIGEENAALLGALFVSRLQQAAQSRQELAESERRPFTLYLDEFHNYLTPSMASILSGGRKYGLGLVLAHQDLSQLGGRETGILGAAIANPATRVCFRLGDGDARKLAEGFSHFDASDLQSLGVGQAICRVEQADKDFNLLTLPLESMSDADERRLRLEAVECSRQSHSRARSEIEAEYRASQSDLSTEVEVRPTPPVEIRDVPAPSVAEASPEGDETKAVIEEATDTPTAPSTAADEGEAKQVPVEGSSRRQHQHGYWKRLVKELAHRHGWIARLEAKLDNDSRVDVLIERAGTRIGVEVSVSTDAAHELENLKKCLDAGLDVVVGIYAEAATLRSIKRRVSKQLTAAQRKQLLLGTPEQVLAQLDGLLKTTESKPSKLRGYVVRVETDEQTPEQGADTLASLIRKLWKSPPSEGEG